MNSDTNCGYVAIVGRPNVGKSTLLNRILGQKISITSRKPQTTRNRILGIKTIDNFQTIYVDTPGMNAEKTRALHRFMNREAMVALAGVDLIVFVIDAYGWKEDDAFVWERLQSMDRPVVMVLNKIDALPDRANVLPTIEELHQKFPNVEIIPISALKGENVDALENVIKNLLPKGPHLFESDQITNMSDEFLVAETVREKIMRVTGKEVPYASIVQVESMEMKKNILHIKVLILVERKGQKIILIGKKGDKLKEIGSKARLDLEKMFACKVFLTIWVKVKSGWSDDENIIKNIGDGKNG